MAEYLTDIEIAQQNIPEKITNIAAALHIDEAYIEQYGNYKAKIDYNFLKDNADKPDGKLILVTAITPTPAGEGKTTTSVGLADGMKKIGKNVVVGGNAFITTSIPEGAKVSVKSQELMYNYDSKHPVEQCSIDEEAEWFYII